MKEGIFEVGLSLFGYSNLALSSFFPNFAEMVVRSGPVIPPLPNTAWHTAHLDLKIFSPLVIAGVATVGSMIIEHTTDTVITLFILHPLKHLTTGRIVVDSVKKHFTFSGNQ